MALLTLAEAREFAGLTRDDAARDASLQAMIAEAIDAVKQHCQNGEIERTQYTQILDAPPSTKIILPYAPVYYNPPTYDFQIYRNPEANGDPLAFTSQHLLTIFRDYTLEKLGVPDPYTAGPGIVNFFNVSVAMNYARPLYSLATKPVPVPGAIKVVYYAGYATAPYAIKMALNLIVRKLFNMRKDGVRALSESLNGYSISRESMPEGIIAGDPTIRKALAPFCRPQVSGYY